MPSIAAHMVIATIVSKKLNIKDKDFIRGNLLPDIISQDNSHYKIKEGNFKIPDTEYYKNNFNLTNKLNLGYYTHLLLDKYYIRYYVKNISPYPTLFINGIIYEEYDKINYGLVKKFNLDVDNLLNILNNYTNYNINIDKLNKNLDNLKINKQEKTIYLKLNDFSNFLINTSNIICKEIEKYGC